MSNSNRNRNRNGGKNDFPFIPVLIACAIFVPGFLGLALPAFVVYQILKQGFDIDLVEEVKSLMGIDNHDKEQHTYSSTVRPSGGQRSSVRRTGQQDPCGNEAYHGTFGEEQKGYTPPRGKVVQQEDPCGNEAYHGTFSEDHAAPTGGKKSQQEDPCGNEAYHGTFSEEPAKAAPKRRTRQSRKRDYFAKKIKGGKALTTAGLTLFLVFAFVMAMEAVELVPVGGLRALLNEDVLTELIFSLSGLGLLAAGRFKSGKAKKFRKIRNLIGESTDRISIHALAEAMPCSDEKAEDLVQTMIDEGLLGEAAYIDGMTGYLILDGKGVAQDAPVRTRKKPEKKEESPEMDTLAEIRRVNASIPDPVMTRKISRIEEITGHILDYQKKHPEKAPELRKFLDYYLPTTLKILNSYAELDSKGLSGDNINTTKERIENMMDNVVEGFETQLDKLFEGDMMDISSDIAVMEKMLSSDGLTNSMRIPKMETSAADEAFDQINLTLEPEGKAEPAVQPMTMPAMSVPAAQPVQQEEEPSEADDMFKSIHQSFGVGGAAQAAPVESASAADDMFKTIHLTLEPDKEPDAQNSWENGFYHRTKEELE